MVTAVDIFRPAALEADPAPSMAAEGIGIDTPPEICLLDDRKCEITSNIVLWAFVLLFYLTRVSSPSKFVSSDFVIVTLGRLSSVMKMS